MGENDEGAWKGVYWKVACTRERNRGQCQQQKLGHRHLHDIHGSTRVHPSWYHQTSMTLFLLFTGRNQLGRVHRHNFLKHKRVIRWNILTFNFWLSVYNTQNFHFFYRTYIFGCLNMHTRHLASVFCHYKKLYLLNYTHATCFINVCATRISCSVSKYTHG